MSIAVREFLMSNGSGGGYYGRNDPRPPIPGKENEPPASTCRNGSSSSTRSSGSYRSHISGRSLSSSSKSHSSGKSRNSGKSRSSLKSRTSSSGKLACLDQAAEQNTSTDRTIIEYCVDRSILVNKDENRDSMYLEPEGSVNGSRLPHSFVESSPQPACLRWAEDFDHLLADRDGVELFRRFLKEESDSAPLDFLLACRGLSFVDVMDAKRIQTLVRTIYKKYVKGDRLGLAQDVRREIADRIRYSSADCSVFNTALYQVEDCLRNGPYLAFLKSEAYLLYVQLGSSGSADNSGGSSDGTVARDSLTAGLTSLATVHEEMELKETVGSGGYRDLSLSFAENATVSSRKVCDACMVPLTSSRYSNSRGLASRRSLSYPYHVSHVPPASKQDSELQSLSSEAMTDDTATSHTTDSTSSVDGGEFGSKWKGKHRSMRRFASVNQHSDLDLHAIIPRTETAPRDRNLAENNPSQFAALLLERLSKVKNELDQEEKLDKITESIHRAESGTSIPYSQSRIQSTSVNVSTALPHYPLDYVVFPSGIEIDLDVEDTYGAQRILEDHVSRVWDDQQLNNTSATPASRVTVDRGHSLCRFIAPSPNVSGASLGTSYGRFVNHLSSSSSLRVPPHRRQYAGQNGWPTPSSYVERAVPCRQFHSTPKSKTRPPYLTSQSDSEMLDERRACEGVEMDDVVFRRPDAVSRSSSVDAINRSLDQGSAYEPHFYSQPNIPDSMSDRSGDSVLAMRSDRRRVATSMAELPNVSRLAALIKSKSFRQNAEEKQSFDQQHNVSSCKEDNSFRADTYPAPGLLPRQSYSAAVLPPPRLYSSTLTGSESTVLIPRANSTVVGFYMGDEKIPYRTTIASTNITLRQFKQLVSKRGSYRYFFKTACDDFDTGVIYEEVVEDDDILPMWEGKIVGKVERTT